MNKNRKVRNAFLKWGALSSGLVAGTATGAGLMMTDTVIVEDNEAMNTLAQVGIGAGAMVGTSGTAVAGVRLSTNKKDDKVAKEVLTAKAAMATGLIPSEDTATITAKQEAITKELNKQNATRRIYEKAIKKDK